MKKHAPLIRANLRIWSKIRVFLGWSKFVSAYVERDKKILKLAVFSVQVAALLIEILLKSELYPRIISLKCADFLVLTGIVGLGVEK